MYCILYIVIYLQFLYVMYFLYGLNNENSI